MQVLLLHLVNETMAQTGLIPAGQKVAIGGQVRVRSPKNSRENVMTGRSSGVGRRLPFKTAPPLQLYLLRVCGFAAVVTAPSLACICVCVGIGVHGTGVPGQELLLCGVRDGRGGVDMARAHYSSFSKHVPPLCVCVCVCV